MKTRKATPAELKAYSEFTSPRMREIYFLMNARNYVEANAVRREVDQYCFDNKIALRPAGMRIVC